MTDKEAIHMLQSYAGMTHKLTDNQGRPKLDQAIESVLNLIQTQQEEIEKKNEVIDEMAKELGRSIFLHYHTDYCSIPEKPCNREKCIKEYFINKLEKE